MWLRPQFGGHIFAKNLNVFASYDCQKLAKNTTTKTVKRWGLLIFPNFFLGFLCLPFSALVVLSPSKGRGHTIDTNIKAKRDNMISELITNYLQNYESESESKIRGEVSMWDLNVKSHLSQSISIRKRKRRNIFGELISL